jgi:hypothetical protein
MADMSQWPQDHPGRICAKCGREVYWLWCDPIYPPPGTCMFDAPHARHCKDFRAHCTNYLSLQRLLDKAPHPDFLKRLDRAGVTLEEAIVWRDKWQAECDAKDAKALAEYAALEKEPVP